MFLLVDGTPLQTPSRDRGIGRYTSALLAGLRAVRPEWRIQVVEHARLEPIGPDRAHGLTFQRFTAPLPYDLAAPENRAVNDGYYADWLLARQPDHVLLASVFEKLGVVPWFVGDRPPTSAVMYDLIPVLFPDQYGVCRPEEKWYARRVRAAAGVDVLFAISAATATDTRRLLGPGGPRVLNIQGAVDPKFVPLPPERHAPAAARVREKFGITRPFVLYVGGPDYRKNLFGALEGFAALPPATRAGLQLVIACFLPDDLRAATLRTAERLDLGGRVVATGFVSDEELLVLYQSCRVFFFPSLYEGLGLPVLEALRCGAPVACSDCSSLPEFAGGSSHLFDPHDPGSMAAALARALVAPADAGRDGRVAFARSFTWERVAEAVAVAIEACRPRPARTRRRVAWVTADAPDAESAEALAALAREFDVELVLPTESVTAGLAARFRALAANEVADRHEAAPFDVFAAVASPRGFHPDVGSVARRHRGLVVLPTLDEAGDPAGELAQAVGRAAGVVVSSARDRRWVRALTDGPVLTRIGPWTSAVLAAGLRAAAARLDAVDARWTDAAANALAVLPGPPPPTVVDDWAALRHEHTRRSAAITPAAT